VHFNQLLRLRSLAHEEEHPFLALIECEGLFLLDDDRLFINGLEHLIRTHAPILHARLTAATRRDGRSGHHGSGSDDVVISYVLFLQSGRCGVGEHFFKGVRRHN
jgi:hypothetical protein